MDLNEIVAKLPFCHVPESAKHLQIKDIQMDSRLVQNGDLFVCINGFTVDGHDFANKAVELGAVAIIAEHELDVSVPVIVVNDTTRALPIIASTFYDDPTKQLGLIGVTGTNGKTTITYILEKIFQTNNLKTGVIGTIQMKIGEDVFPVKNTTPDALSLQKAYRSMIDQSVDVAIMEVSSHALDMGRVHGCDFDVAIFTNLSQDHLDYHKDMDDYLHAKSLLFSQLGNTYDLDKPKFAILNADESHCELLRHSTAQPIITYGCNHDADVKATNIRLEMTGTHFTMETPIGSVEIDSKLVGMFNVYNMLAASSAAIAKNISLSVIQEALHHLSGVDGRFEAVRAGQDFTVIVDYAHTEDSLENVLKTVQEFAEKKVYVVVGCGGERDKTKRPLMAQVAVKYADLAIFTSDNPRGEDPNEILNDMIRNIQQNNFEVQVDRKEAINRAVELASEGDLILIAGKGHETTQVIGKVAHEFDDKVVAKEAIEKKGN